MTDTTDNPDVPVDTIALLDQAREAIKPDDNDPGVEERKAILESQLAQFSQTRFNHKTNLSRLLSLGNPDDIASQIRDELEAIAAYDNSIANTQNQIDSLK